jgi:hypothetical protein
MKTGRTVEEPGLYLSECCDEERVFDLGDTFQRCPRCLNLCNWEFEAEFVTPDTQDETNGIAA